MLVIFFVRHTCLSFNFFLFRLTALFPMYIFLFLISLIEHKQGLNTKLRRWILRAKAGVCSLWLMSGQTFVHILHVSNYDVVNDVITTETHFEFFLEPTQTHPLFHSLLNFGMTYVRGMNCHQHKIKSG